VTETSRAERRTIARHHRTAWVRMPRAGYTPGTGSEPTDGMTTHTAALPYTAEAARDARSHVARLLGGRCSLATIQTASLLTSELATNAVLHAAPPVHLHAQVTEAIIRVEVHDGGAGSSPALRKARETDPGGRGLAIIEALASRWGAEPTRGGNVVWFELTYG
jgi:anti-sigma regulatory factor (Ser/Thr protein kinase)